MESQGTASFPSPGSAAQAVASGARTPSQQPSPQRQATRTGRIRRNKLIHTSFQELCTRTATSRNSRFLNMKAAKHVPYHYMNFYLNNNLTIASKKHGIHPRESKERQKRIQLLQPQQSQLGQDSTLRATFGSKLAQARPAMENDYVGASLEATGSSAGTMRTQIQIIDVNSGQHSGTNTASAGGRATGSRGQPSRAHEEAQDSEFERTGGIIKQRSQDNRFRSITQKTIVELNCDRGRRQQTHSLSKDQQESSIDSMRPRQTDWHLRRSCNHRGPSLLEEDEQALLLGHHKFFQDKQETLRLSKVLQGANIVKGPKARAQKMVNALQMQHVNQQFSMSDMKQKENKRLAGYWKEIQKTNQKQLDGRDVNSQLVTHGGYGDRRQAEEPQHFIDKIKAKDICKFNNSLEQQVMRTIGQGTSYRHHDRYNLNQIFGLPHEIEGMQEEKEQEGVEHGILHKADTSYMDSEWPNSHTNKQIMNNQSIKDSLTEDLQKQKMNSLHENQDLPIQAIIQAGIQHFKIKQRQLVQSDVQDLEKLEKAKQKTIRRDIKSFISQQQQKRQDAFRGNKLSRSMQVSEHPAQGPQKRNSFLDDYAGGAGPAMSMDFQDQSVQSQLHTPHNIVKQLEKQRQNNESSPNSYSQSSRRPPGPLQKMIIDELRLPQQHPKRLMSIQLPNSEDQVGRSSQSPPEVRERDDEDDDNDDKQADVMPPLPTRGQKVNFHAFVRADQHGVKRRPTPVEDIGQRAQRGERAGTIQSRSRVPVQPAYQTKKQNSMGLQTHALQPLKRNVDLELMAAEGREEAEDILVGSGQVHQPAVVNAERAVLFTPDKTQTRTLTSKQTPSNQKRDMMSGAQSGLSGVTEQRTGYDKSAQDKSRRTSTARNAQELDEGLAEDNINQFQSKLSSYWKLDELITDKQETTRNEVSQKQLQLQLGASAVQAPAPHGILVSQENQNSQGLEVSGYRQCNIKHIQITHEHDRTNGMQELKAIHTHISIVEGDESSKREIATGVTPGASRLTNHNNTHSHLSQKYETGAPNPSVDLAQSSGPNDQSATKPSPSKQKTINVAKLMFDQDKGYKKPELYQPEPFCMTSPKQPILQNKQLTTLQPSIRQHSLINSSVYSLNQITSPQTQSPKAANVKSSVPTSKPSKLKLHGSRKTSEVELASQILKRVLEKTESKVKVINGKNCK